MHAYAPQVAVRHAEPLTEPQAIGDCGVQQWAMEAETLLDHELQAMHRSVSEAVSSDAEALLLRPIGNLASLEDFIR